MSRKPRPTCCPDYRDQLGVRQHWSIPRPTQGKREMLARQIEANLGAELSPLGLVRPLTSAELTQRPMPLAPTAPDRAGWHGRAAARAEEGADWYMAHWHLSRLLQGAAG